MNHRKALFLTILCLGFGAVPPASAAITVFDVTWSGASFGNSAMATGKISIDTALLPNPGSVPPSLLSPIVSNINLTVSGASVGNGLFGTSDFDIWIWNTAGVTLNLTTELLGQGGWGTTTSGTTGDFNLRNTTVSAPRGVGFFVMRTANGTGDRLRLTSFAVAVPEPSRMLLATMGGLVLLLHRRRNKAV